MNFRWLMVLLAVGGFGGAHGPRAAEPQVPQYEHVFQKPLAEALAVTRELLASKGYAFEDTQDPGQLLTAWEQPDLTGSRNNTYTRYLVTGIAVSPRQSVVRIFKVTQQTAGNDAEWRNVWWKMYSERAEQRSPAFVQSVSLSESTLNKRLDMLRGLQRGTRDLELEKALTLRLESAPSVEVVDGNVKQDLPPPPDIVRRAGSTFYRWTAYARCRRGAIPASPRCAPAGPAGPAS